MKKQAQGLRVGGPRVARSLKSPQMVLIPLTYNRPFGTRAQADLLVVNKRGAGIPLCRCIEARSSPLTHALGLWRNCPRGMRSHVL